MASSFITSVYDCKNLPADKPFVVFAGRSNVGKSSAVNRLLGKKGLARVSKKPGKTAAMNLYDSGEGYYLADLPGYGYARVSHAVKEDWARLMEGFFASDREIRLVVQFVDVRHEPQKTDLEMTAFLAATGLPFTAVFTKADKLSKAEAEESLKSGTKALRATLKGTAANMLAPVLFSAESGLGADILAAVIRQCATETETAES